MVGIGKDVTENEIIKTTTIKDLDETEINMTSIVIIGNKNTYVADGHMITKGIYTMILLLGGTSESLAVADDLNAHHYYQFYPSQLIAVPSWFKTYPNVYRQTLTETFHLLC